MSDLVLAQKDPAIILAEVLERYRQRTGVTLQPADPRRLHLEALLYEVVQLRALIDFAGKQSLLRHVSSLWIRGLAELWGEDLLSAEPSTCTVRFTFSASAPHTVPGGTRVTDGTNVWRVKEDTGETGTTVEATVECLVTGSATNGIAIGQIDTAVDPDDLPGLLSVSNITETDGGRDIEDTEPFRERLRDVPESRSTCGPRVAYRAAALEVSPTVADAAVIGRDDAAEVASYAADPGEVIVLIIKGTRDTNGDLLSIEPEPDDGLIEAVEEALSAEDVRPLTDHVIVQAPLWHDFDCVFTYWIARSRSNSASEIQAEVEDAYDAYLLWQQSVIGRDINPSEAIARLMTAGAKRVQTSLTHTALLRDECARAQYVALVYGGVEDD